MKFLVEAGCYFTFHLDFGRQRFVLTNGICGDPICRGDGGHKLTISESQTWFVETTNLGRAAASLACAQHGGMTGCAIQTTP